MSYRVWTRSAPYLIATCRGMSRRFQEVRRVFKMSSITLSLVMDGTMLKARIVLVSATKPDM